MMPRCARLHRDVLYLMVADIGNCILQPCRVVVEQYA